MVVSVCSCLDVCVYVYCVCMCAYVCAFVQWYGRRAARRAAGQLQQSQLWQWCGPTSLRLNGDIHAGGDLATEEPQRSCHFGS